MTESTSTVRQCVVCNMGSHRKAWKNTVGKYVACDAHSQGEVKLAITKLEATQKQAQVDKNRRLGLSDDGKAKLAPAKIQAATPSNPPPAKPSATPVQAEPPKVNVAG